MSNASFDDVTAMLTSLGPDLDVSAISALSEERSWAIAIDDDGAEIIGIELDETDGRLVFNAHLGVPPAERELATYRFLLGLNAGWPETGGVWTGIGPDDHEIIVFVGLPLLHLTADVLGTVIKNFIAARGTLTALIAAGIGEDGPDADNPMPDPSLGYMRA
ncbi:MAG: type III secretion system chaperone [Pseudomonadota bacterium]